MRAIAVFFILVITLMMSNCTTSKKEENEKTGPVKLMTLDPGHFHAALVQKFMYPQVGPEVFVFSPVGPDVEDHLNRISGFNTRSEDPTSWEEIVYSADDFLQKMIMEKPGNVVVTSGNNAKKTEYIKTSIDAGIHVLADKPMAIVPEDFEELILAFESAKQNNVLLYDIMTERHEITTLLQKELSHVSGVFGQLVKGSPEAPAITKESVHHFFKYVSGNPIKRPAWFFDVTQQGEGIVDVTTHLVDLVQWECFPGKVLDYKKDIDVYKATRWPTRITPAQFERVTKLENYPEYLTKDVVDDSVLNVFANGEIQYTLKGVHAKVKVVWNYEAPEGAKDTHYSIMRGSISNLVIRQGAEQEYKPILYVEKANDEDMDEFQEELNSAINRISENYPGIGMSKIEKGWRIDIPDKYKVGHEAHFTQVTQKFLQYLEDGKLPDWEVPNMIAKYYTTTKAYELSR